MDTSYTGDWLLRLRPNGKWNPNDAKERLVGSRIDYSDTISPLQGQVPIGFAAAAASDYKLQVGLAPTSNLPGAEVTLTASLSDRGWPAPSGKVDVTATTPGLSGSTFPLFDDGTNGDAVAGDAVWTASFQQTAATGSYKFHWYSVGKNERGELAPREATRYLTLMPPQDPPKGGGDSGLPCNPCTWLKIIAVLALLTLVLVWLCCCRPKKEEVVIR